MTNEPAGRENGRSEGGVSGRDTSDSDRRTGEGRIRTTRSPTTARRAEHRELGASAADVRAVLERTHRLEYGRIVSVLTRVLGSVHMAEDVVQAASARALERWSASGIPASPGAWLTTVARRIALDALRRRGRELDGEPELPSSRHDDPYEILGKWPDERLELLFLCCHPALDDADRCALTLREVGGLATREIARAFLVRETTMAQRLVRAKRRLREAGAQFDLPDGQAILSRLDSVLDVLYLIFNEGYAACSGEDLIRTELCDEAISLTRLLASLLKRRAVQPEPEVDGLLALMLLSHSRRHARTDTSGVPVLLDSQDRSLWVADEASEGLRLVDRALRRGRPGPFQMKAAINAVHHAAVDAGDTDWREILALYGELMKFEPTPVVALNRAVALGMLEGPMAAIAAMGPLTDALAGYQPFHVARAHFLALAGDSDAAAAELRRALGVAQNRAQARFIERRLSELSSPASGAHG